MGRRKKSECVAEPAGQITVCDSMTPAMDKVMAKYGGVTTQTLQIATPFSIDACKEKYASLQCVDHFFAEILTSDLDITKNGKPTNHGLHMLLRVFGYKIDTKTVNVHVISPDNVSVSVSMGISSEFGVPELGLPKTAFIAGAADCNPQNTPDVTFSAHATAMAETRAVSRAIRSFFNLKTISADEDTSPMPQRRDIQAAAEAAPKSFADTLMDKTREAYKSKGVDVDAIYKEVCGTKTFAQLTIEERQLYINALQQASLATSAQAAEVV